MNLCSFELNNFRNYLHTIIDIQDAQNIFFIGENGQGKTNLLEALYYISYASSFRSNKNDVLIQHGSTNFSIRAQFREEQITHTLAISYEKKNKETSFTTIQK